MIHLYSGFIYVMTRDVGDVKIGISRESYQRLTEVRDNAADRLAIAAVWGHQHPRRVEALAHRLLKEFETDKEWFAVSKYAFDAVCRAMLKVDKVLKLSPAPPEPPLPAEAPTPTIVLPAPYSVPKTAPVPGIKFLIGYARDSADAPLAQQAQWLWESGVRGPNIHVDVPGALSELDCALKDCRTGDGLMVWSPRIIEPSGFSVSKVVSEKGARLIHAIS